MRSKGICVEGSFCLVRCMKASPQFMNELSDPCSKLPDKF